MPRGGAREGAGRPRGSKTERCLQLFVRVTQEELDLWDEAAYNEGLDRSNWVRQTLDRRAKRAQRQ